MRTMIVTSILAGLALTALAISTNKQMLSTVHMECVETGI